MKTICSKLPIEAVFEICDEYGLSIRSVRLIEEVLLLTVDPFAVSFPQLKALHDELSTLGIRYTTIDLSDY